LTATSLGLWHRDHGRFDEGRPLLEQTEAESVRIRKELPKPDRRIEEFGRLAQFLLGRWPGLAPDLRPAQRPPDSFRIETPFRAVSPVPDGRIFRTCTACRLSRGFPDRQIRHPRLPGSWCSVMIGMRRDPESGDARSEDSPMSALQLSQSLTKLDPAGPRFATEAVDQVLAAARAAGASDVHFHPRTEGLDIRWRIDGVLQPVAVLPARVGPNVVARLKVLGDLLTYRTDVPQEGRIRGVPGDAEMRLSTFPTLHGEKAVVRVFAAQGRILRLADLGLPGEVSEPLSGFLDETSGAIILCGPAGSGKTTTIYACLRELAARSKGERSLASLEDPIESVVEGVAQSQVNPAAGLTLESGLKALLRQDPEVIAIGEIRDRTTAEIALQAALTGHLTLTTFHAGSACEAIGRLLDMGIEPYAIRSGLRAVIAQRLVRRLCPMCSIPADRPEDFLGLPVATARIARGCESCAGTGYQGRIVLAELLLPDREDLGQAILARVDVRRLEHVALASGMIDRWERARQAVEQGLTSAAEIRRGLGVGNPAGAGDGKHEPQMNTDEHR
jgi:general secretion pathway protein E